MEWKKARSGCKYAEHEFRKRVVVVHKKNEIRRENLRDIDGWGMTGVSAVGRLCRWQREKNPATYSVSYFIYYLLALLGCDRMSLGECLFEKFDFEFLADCV